MKFSPQTCKFPRNLSSLKPLASKVQHQHNKILINWTVWKKNHREITYTYKPVSCCWKSSFWRSLLNCWSCQYGASVSTILHDVIARGRNDWRPNMTRAQAKFSAWRFRLTTAGALYCCYRKVSHSQISQISPVRRRLLFIYFPTDRLHVVSVDGRLTKVASLSENGRRRNWL